MNIVIINKHFLPDIKDLLCDGVTIAIIKRIENLLVYRFNSCQETVENNIFDPSPVVQCRQCGFGACSTCQMPESSNKCSFICPPCEKALYDYMVIPDSLLMSSSGKKKTTFSQEVKESQGESTVKSSSVNSFSVDFSSAANSEFPNSMLTQLTQPTQDVASLPCAQPHKESQVPDLNSSVISLTSNSDENKAEDDDKNADNAGEKDDFEEPSHVKWKRAQKENKMAEREASQAEISKSKSVCKHFLKGCCHNVFSGKGAKGPKESCKSYHPKVCKPWLDNGSSVNNKSKGCVKGQS